MLPSLAARETYVAETNFAARKQKKNQFLLQVKNIFASRTQMLLSKHMFPSLATMETMLTRFQRCSLKIFPSNGKQTTMADGEVEVGEKGKKEWNWKDEEREEDEDCMNRDKIWYHKVKMYEGTSPVTKKKKEISPDLFESLIIMHFPKKCFLV